MHMLLSEPPSICLMETKCWFKWSHLFRKERERNWNKPNINRCQRRVNGDQCWIQDF